jgi:hypothetical protein
MAIVEGLKRQGVNVFSAKDDFLRIALNKLTWALSMFISKS